MMTIPAHYADDGLSDGNNEDHDNFYAKDDKDNTWFLIHLQVMQKRYCKTPSHLWSFFCHQSRFQ